LKIESYLDMKNIATILLMTAWLLTGCSQKTTVEKSGFVKKQGAGFVLDGQEYRFVGTNFWYGAILGSEGQGGNRERLCRELDQLHALGLDNLRILVGSDGERGVTTKVEPTLQLSPGVYNDTILAGLDFLLKEMGQRGMKAVLYLNNAWEWSGGYGFYLEQAGAGKAPRPNETSYPEYMSFVSQFSTNAEAQELYFQYVRDIIGRTNRYTEVPYVDDPAIMSWQIGNEPRAFSDEAKAPFAKWLSQASALIRSLDKNHLISIGSEGIWGCEMDADLYEQICSDPNIDYMNAHVWPYNWSWALQDSLAQHVERACQNTAEYIHRHTAIAERLQKPLVIEEFGYPRDGFVFEPGSKTEGRDRYYDFIFSLIKNEPTVYGCNFWGWGGEARPTHEQWQVGDDYCGDPAQEQQGLNSVFLCDTTTLQVVVKHTKVEN
jgi:mannan endo-1,4-beta-mannosidase